MPRSRKGSNNSPIGVGMTAKQMRRKKPINSDLMVDINPLTENQEKFLILTAKDKTYLHMDVLVQEKLSLPYT